MSLFSGINARLRGTTGRTGSGRSPTTPTADVPSPLGGPQASSSLEALPGIASAGSGLGVPTSASSHSVASSSNSVSTQHLHSGGGGGNSGSSASNAASNPAVSSTTTQALPGQAVTSQSSGNGGGSGNSGLPVLAAPGSELRSSGGSTSNSVNLQLLQAQPLPLWLNPAYAKHIVKGNFMTLSARPKTVEQGEWIAHQVVEHYRLLWNFVRLIYEKEKDGSCICNPMSCPKMSAGRNHSYTWLNSRFEPIELPAREYISLMQRWISGKIDDTNIFPTDPTTVSFASNPVLASASSQTPLYQLAAAAAASSSSGAGSAGTGGADSAASASASASSASATAAADDWVGKSSGFPRDFVGVCRTIFLQMFRVYAHLYWDHFVEPFYHLNLEKQLNSCFSHFLLTATALNMLKPEDIEPMQLLVDLWAASGTFPPESKAYALANLENGRRLMQGNEG